ncbi:DUF4231 domain-containing protein [Streptomyces sp. VRA16 Mangrove soil]|nr:DUF4231 domain-containing protein [Streptomyces sp. VRA16 Mangrove soil]
MFGVNDRLAVSRQTEAVRAVRTQLTLLLAATAVSAVSGLAGWDDGAWIAAGVYALALLFSVRISRRRARVHYQAHREVAESVKSLSWMYMAGGGDFQVGGDTNPDVLFAVRLDERLRELVKVGWDAERCGEQPAGAGQITPTMREVRCKPFPVRRDFYLRDRLEEQLAWYGGKSETARHSAALWNIVITLLTAGALGMTVLRAWRLHDTDLTGLFSAAAAAAVAWNETRRHRPLTYAHHLIEQDLGELREAMLRIIPGEGERTEKQWAQMVAASERLVLPQHTDWLARFGGK